MFNRKFSRLIITGLCVTVLVGCGTSTTPTAPSGNPAVAEVTPETLDRTDLRTVATQVMRWYAAGQTTKVCALKAEKNYLGRKCNQDQSWRVHPAPVALCDYPNGGPTSEIAHFAWLGFDIEPAIDHNHWVEVSLSETGGRWSVISVSHGKQPPGAETCKPGSVAIPLTAGS